MSKFKGRNIFNALYKSVQNVISLTSMDHVDKALLLSLKQDLRTLDEVVEKITATHSGSIQIRSWIFPTKQGRFVKEFIRDNRIFETDNVKLYLELIIDRLHVGIRIILDYLDNKLESESLGRNSYVHRPQQITIGCSFENLWEIIRTVVRQMTEKQIPSSYRKSSRLASKIDRCSQTDIKALDKCDSCASAICCMKNLMDIFDSMEGDRGSLKRKIRPKIYDITQFACMYQTTTSIEKSLNSMSEKLYDAVREKNKVIGENQTLKNSNEEFRKQIYLLKEELKAYKEKCEHDSSKLSLLSLQNDELVKSRMKHGLQVKSMEQMIETVKKSMKTSQAQNKRLVSENSRLGQLCRRIRKGYEKVLEDSCLIERRIHIYDYEIKSIEDGLREFGSITIKIQNNVDVVSQMCNGLTLRLSNIKKDNHDVFEVLLHKFMNFKQSVRAIKDIRNSKQVSNPNDKKPQVKGNPLEDIATQIEENNRKIEALQDENRRLRNILDKFRRIKS